MIVYVDLIFLMNMLIDATVLLAAVKVLKLNVKLWRLILSSMLGAFYVILMIFPQWSFLFTFMLKLLFSCVMVLIAFGFGSLQSFLRSLGAFYVLNFVAAGGVFALHYMFMSSNQVMDGMLFSTVGGVVHQVEISWITIFTALILSLWLAKGVVISRKRREQLVSFMASVDVRIGDFTWHCNGLIDTGNQLYDPLTRTPVMIMEAIQFKEHFSEKWFQIIKQGDTGQMIAAIGQEPFIWEDRLRLIPYRGVNRSMQYVLALKPDSVVIRNQTQCIETKKVLVGLDGGKLCSDGSYQAIIHPSLVHASDGNLEEAGTKKRVSSD
ncbi:MAG: sigma-E processing peptidase SpoIIGA [Paenibacillus sp. RIFOXYA1_FULL_44_5]|nr:MAG: sigma-E processing peptidase SpoIIGA [Paenibacillus sp. RIFOXYA1_FULL_44_5]